MHARRVVLALALALLVVVSCDTWRALRLVLLNWGQNAPPLVCLALAAGVVLSCRSLDIASGAIFSLCGMLLILLANLAPEFVLLGTVAALGFALAVYYLMGLLSFRLGIPALLCTLAAGFCAKSGSVLIYSYLKGVGLFSSPEGLVLERRLNLTTEQSIPLLSNTGINLIWTAGLIGVLWLWRSRSDWGIKHIAVGMDASAARMAGIDASAIRVRAFLVAGGLVGLGALFFLFDASQGGWSPDIGWNRELIAIAAAVIGGTRITGGRFDALSIALAAVLIFALRDVVDSFGWPPDYSLLATGVALIAIGIIDSAQTAPGRKGQRRPGRVRGTGSSTR